MAFQEGAFFGQNDSKHEGRTKIRQGFERSNMFARTSLFITFLIYPRNITKISAISSFSNPQDTRCERGVSKELSRTRNNREHRAHRKCTKMHLHEQSPDHPAPASFTVFVHLRLHTQEAQHHIHVDSRQE